MSKDTFKLGQGLDRTPRGRGKIIPVEKPKILFVDSQEAERINALGLPPYPTWVGKLLGTGIEIVSVNVADGERLPQDLAKIDGIISGGSGHLVKRRHPWMDEMATFFEKAEREGVPGLHICFGHHIRAHDAGSEVVTHDNKRVGVKTVQLTEAGINDPLTTGLPEEFELFTSNRDVVTTLPPTQNRREVKVTELARSVSPFNDPNEILAYIDPITGKVLSHSIQAHLDMTAREISKLLGENGNQFTEGHNLTTTDANQILAHALVSDADITAINRKILANWMEYYVKPAREIRRRNS